MRVAVFHNLQSGGAKRALYGFVKYLKRSGHSVEAHLPGTADEEYLPLAPVADKCFVYAVRWTLRGLISSAVRYLPPVNCSLADLERVHKQIAVAINGGRYDMVLVEQDQYVMSPFLLKFLERPAVYYCQQPLRLGQGILQNLARQRPSGFLRNIWYEHFVNRKLPAIDRRNASAARYILANSYFSRECILGAYGLNSFVSYLGVDPDVFKPLAARRENVVLSVGSVTMSKGYDFLVRALGQIKKAIRPRLLIVANAVDEQWNRYIERLASERGVALTIELRVSDLDLTRLYNRAKVFVYASYLEPFGLAPIEALACGTPVVAVKEGGVRESIVDGETGLLTERDEAQFASAVTDLLSSDKTGRRLAERGVDAVRSFWTLEQAGARLLGHLERARRTPSVETINVLTAR